MAEPPANTNPESEEQDAHLSLPERRPRRLKKLPARFRDILPEAPPALPPNWPAAQAQGSANQDNQDSTPHAQHTGVLDGLRSAARHLRRIFRSPRNVFGLFRQYQGECPPIHDPEEHVGLKDLSNMPHVPGDTADAADSFYPYPNRNSFLLGDWYWNNGAQKSQSSFKELLKIVGSSDFEPSDVQGTKWHQINQKLGSEIWEKGEEDAEWLDVDAGWIKDSVTISVPFHRRTLRPGSQLYHVADFYHRNLCSVIKETLANPKRDQHFHYEPYELYYDKVGSTSTDVPSPVRVYGELYTSPAFVDAHQQLQDSPKEPGCDLPRVVIALMFWSDSTHLASFSDAKIWPLYLFCGNESKYQRCKPSCNLCSHVAYFHKV